MLTDDGHAIFRFLMFWFFKKIKMEYLKSLKSVLGAPQDDQVPTAAETVSN